MNTRVYLPLDPAVTAHAVWLADAQCCDRILADNTTTEAEIDAAWNRYEASTRKLIKTPATTLEGVALKMTTTANWRECTQDEDDEAGLADGLRHEPAAEMHLGALWDLGVIRRREAEQAPVAA